MSLTNDSFNKKEEYTDGKYSVYSFSGEKGNFRRVACTQESICILPFDLNHHNQIRNLYLAKYKDYLSDRSEFTCICDTFNRNEFDSYYSAIEDVLKKEMGLDNINIDDVYYIGMVKHGVPFSKEYRCYAINLTRYQDDPTGFTVNLPEKEINSKLNSIERVKFNKLIKGEIRDSLVLSCSLLLISDLSE